MQKVRTMPSSSMTTWLCSHVISGKSSSTRARERRLTAGIWSSVTSKLRTIRYLGIRPDHRPFLPLSHVRRHTVPCEMLVLVTDDDRAVRESLERALQLAGYEVEL